MKYSHLLEQLSKYAGFLAAILVFVLALLVSYDALMRYLFSEGSIALQELEWHLFDVVFLLGISYALKHDKHVRVDIFFERYTHDTKVIVQILAMMLLVIPFNAMMIMYAYDMTLQSYIQHEISADPGGLGSRWIVKSILLLAFVLLMLQAISEILKAYYKLDNKVMLLKTFVGVVFVATLVYIAWYNRVTFWFDPVFLMFGMALILLLAGFQVAFVFGGTALFFALISDEVGPHVLEMLPYRTYGIMGNITLMAVPLFILMGLILEKSKMAEVLLESMGKLFGPIRGGVAVSVVLVGAILAASTGIVGASVVMMSLIALPLMLKHGYASSVASGAIVASGTLGQLIPPSIVLIVLGDQMHLSVGDLFKAAVVPGLLLIVLYVLYILLYALIKPSVAPAITLEQPYVQIAKGAFKAIIPPLLLIGAVLGSIFVGIASPTESAAIGVLGSIVLATYNRVFS
ncbi:MAG: TRAP transporter large permease subunit, partial [Sulfurovum sp.]|nr:TRAP transporter large permease subunit [Sulfurovum sp.]